MIDSMEKLAESSFSASTVNIDNVFTTDYRIYKVIFSNVRFSSGSNAIDGRLLNSSGNAITATNYRRAVERVKDTGSFNQFRSTGQRLYG